VFKSAGWRTEAHFTDGVVGIEFDIDPDPDAIAARQAREHQSEARSVARILHPSAIAVIGAGRSRRSFGHQLLLTIVQGGFTGAVHVVHPQADEVAGIRAVPTVTAIDGPVDLAFVVVPAPAVADVVEDCARKGVRGLVIMTAGFADEGEEGAAAEVALVAAAHAGGMRVVGPNTMGIVNTHPDVRLHGVLGSEPTTSTGCLGLLAQSGGLGIGLLRWASRPGLGVSTFVATGNKADVSGNDMLQYWADDERTTVVGLYLESFGNPRKFARVARAVAQVKPVLAVKSGGRGDEATVDALFAQAGVLRVDAIRTMLDAAAFLANQPLPAGRRVRVLASRGSPVPMAVDGVERAGLTVADVVVASMEDPAEYGAAVRSAVGVADAVLAVYTPPLGASRRSRRPGPARWLPPRASSTPAVGRR
jgi:acyl-CoA synthetase (NDP forming)